MLFVQRTVPRCRLRPAARGCQRPAIHGHPRLQPWPQEPGQTLKPFLAKGGASAADVEKMHAAWVKSVLLQTILWSHPYVQSGKF